VEKIQSLIARLVSESNWREDVRRLVLRRIRQESIEELTPEAVTEMIMAEAIDAFPASLPPSPERPPHPTVPYQEKGPRRPRIAKQKMTSTTTSAVAPESGACGRVPVCIATRPLWVHVTFIPSDRSCLAFVSGGCRRPIALADGLWRNDFVNSH
jgi:hypothetical protein